MTLSDIVYKQDESVAMYRDGYYYHTFTDTDDNDDICQRFCGITITKPYKENKIIWLDRWSSTTPSASVGYQMYNSSLQKIQYRSSSGWITYDMQEYSETGVLYYYVSTGYLYKWTGSTLTQFTPSASNMCVMLLTDDTGSNYQKDTWYYDTTSGYLYRCNGFEWQKVLYAKPVSDYWLYALNGCVYNAYHVSSSDHRFYDYYYACDLTITRTGDNVTQGTLSLNPPQGMRKYVYKCVDSQGYAESAIDLYPGDYADTGTYYRIKAEYHYRTDIVYTANKCYLLDGTSNTYESITTELICGRAGSISTSLTQTSTLTMYNLVDDTMSFTYTCTPSSSNPAGILRPKGKMSSAPYGEGPLYYNEYESKYGVVWKIYGSEGYWRELRIMENAGVVKVINGTSSVNTSSISIQFLNPGQYYVGAYSWHQSSVVSSAHVQDSISTGMKVYNPSKPAIAIVSVSPSEYQSSSADPLDGKAPYTVVFQDTSASTDSSQIPQASILVDFGDSDSGTDNTVLIPNNTNALITIPNQTHVYDGYSGYVIKMTITDKRGNVTTGSVAFEPNKNPRIISTPTITYSPSSLVAPVLATGEANVAGYPLPTVYWHYEYDDYEGDEEGETVEMSLIKACASGEHYTITCTPEDLATTTWTPEITAPSSVSDDSQTMHDFDLVVLDSSGNAIDWCKQHSSIQYIEYYQDLDVFSFEIPETYAYAQYLQEGNYLILGYKNKARLMQVTYRGRNGSTITISGESAFPERITITATKSTAGDGYDTQAYTGETLIRYFIASCLTDPYPDTTTGAQPRGADFVVFGADGETGGTVTYSARYNRLRDVINEICSGANLGYTICARQSGLTKAGMKIYSGTDRTYTSGGSDMVVFSPKRLKNCIIESDQSALSRNVSIGAGEGVGNYRSYSYYGQTSTTGFNRREMFTDAGDSANSDEVERMSELALKEDKQLSIRIRVLPTCQWTFGTDYNVGDVVTLESPDRGSLDLQIYSAEYCRRATGDELYLNLGYECASAPTLIRRTAKENTYARK